MKKMLSLILVMMMMAIPMAAMADATATTETEAAAEVAVEAAPEAAIEAAPEVAVEEAATAEAEAEAIVGMANPFVECTDVEASAQLGATYTITAPEGFALTETARLSDELMAQGEKPLVRVVYMMEDAMYRVHITKDATPLVPVEGEVEIDVNGTKAIYNAAAFSITYAQGEYVITVDSANYTQDQLVATVGTVIVTPAPVAEEAVATETTEAAATEATDAAATEEAVVAEEAAN